MCDAKYLGQGPVFGCRTGAEALDLALSLVPDELWPGPLSVWEGADGF